LGGLLMPWAKLHTDILSDPKLMRAARQGRGELQLLPWFVVFAKEANDGGRLSVGGAPAHPEDIADQLPGVTAAAVHTGLESLLAIGVLSRDVDDCLRFAKWEDRQAKPSDSKEARAERQRRSRATRRKAEAAATNGHSPRESRGAELLPPEAPAALAGTPPEVVSGDLSRPIARDTVTPCHATEQKRGEQNREQSRARDAAVATNGAEDRPVGMAYVTRCVVALNAAMQANPLVAPNFRELAASCLSGQVEWEQDGIDIEVVEEVIAERGASFRPAPLRRQVHSLKYFDAAVRERWAQLLAAGATDRTSWPLGARNASDAAWLKKQGY
jgi:hypothetical protein